jgi:hypothetical protein
VDVGQNFRLQLTLHQVVDRPIVCIALTGQIIFAESLDEIPSAGYTFMRRQQADLVLVNLLVGPLLIGMAISLLRQFDAATLMAIQFTPNNDFIRACCSR